jgi:hypothetical protein
MASNQDHATDGLSEGPLRPTVFITSRKRSASVEIGCLVVLAAGPQLLPKAFKLGSSGLTEVVIEITACLHLGAVDKYGARPGEWLTVLVVVAEERYVPGIATVLSGYSGDVVIYELRR